LPDTELRGDFGPAVKAVVMILTLPKLKHMIFRGYLDPFVEEVIKNNKRKDIVVDYFTPRLQPPPNP
jgi:hypothetical protein